MNNNVTVQIFRIKGQFRHKRRTSNFSKEICALTEDQAKEKLYSELGSRNRLKRVQIRINKIEKIEKEDITDPLIQKIVNTEFIIPYEGN
ncbi:MAG: 50S ribosomal protein L18Ae [Candidatus Hodarchaeales archaeon]